MKQLYLLILLLSAIGTNAQITIQRSDYAMPGDLVRFQIDTPAPSNLSSTILIQGANKTWNFSSLVPSFQYDSLRYSTPAAGSPPLANLNVQTSTGGHYEWVDSNFARMILDRPNNNITGLAIKFLKFPLTFGSTLVDSMIYYRVGTPADFNAPILGTIGYDSVRAVIKVYDTSTVVGWGVLNLPDTTCNVLQVKISTVANTNLYAHSPFSGWTSVNSLAGIVSHQRNVEYQWIAKNCKNYMARAAMDSNNVNVQRFDYRVKKVVLPAITALTPARARKGQTLNVVIRCSNTRFTAGTTTISISNSKNTLTVNSVAVINDTVLSANLSITQSNSSGLYDVSVTDPIAGTVTQPSAFQVDSSLVQPKIVGINPNTIAKGQAISVTVSGSGTHFMQQSASTNIGFDSSGSTYSKLAVSNLTVLNDSTISFSLKADITSAISAYNLNVSDFIEGNLSLGQAISVTVPSGLAQNQANATIKLYPNPVHNVLNINADPSLLPAIVSVYDMQGRCMKSLNLDAELAGIDLSEMKAGMYFITITNERSCIQKMIILNNE